MLFTVFMITPMDLFEHVPLTFMLYRFSYPQFVIKIQKMVQGKVENNGIFANFVCSRGVKIH